jgi:hypothetical protein
VFCFSRDQPVVDEARVTRDQAAEVCELAEALLRDNHSKARAAARTPTPGGTTLYAACVAGRSPAPQPADARAARHQVSEGALLALRTAVTRSAKSFEPHLLKLLPALVRPRARLAAAPRVLCPGAAPGALRGCHVAPYCAGGGPGAACGRHCPSRHTRHAPHTRADTRFSPCAARTLQVERLGDSKATVRDAARELVLAGLAAKARAQGRRRGRRQAWVWACAWSKCPKFGPPPVLCGWPLPLPQALQPAVTFERLSAAWTHKNARVREEVRVHAARRQHNHLCPL